MQASNIQAPGGELARIEHEIELLQVRLAQMHDDCAYEKAMARAYERMLNERRLRLASLQQAT